MPLKATPKVFLYMDALPQKNGSGAHLRFYSNTRAYLDLGFEVEAVQVAAQCDHSKPSADLKGLAWLRVIAPAAGRSAAGALAYRLAWPSRAACGYVNPMVETIRQTAIARERAAPGALHQFEGDTMAAAVPFLPGLNKIVSSHCLGSETIEQMNRIAGELEGRQETVAEHREFRFTRALEQKAARHSRLVLCVSTFDRDVMQKQWVFPRAEYLPMSIPDESRMRPASTKRKGDRINLIHVGALAHLPSFRSLEFLVGTGFPALIAGRAGADLAESCRVPPIATAPGRRNCSVFLRRIRRLSWPGFSSDIYRELTGSDLHVVGVHRDSRAPNADYRDPLAYGLPVLSTTAGNSLGIEGLRGGENILLAERSVAHLRRRWARSWAPAAAARLGLCGGPEAV